MTKHDLNILLTDLLSTSHEHECIEFKLNNDSKLGEYISGLANSACIAKEKYAYLVFGVDDSTLAVVGTSINLNKKGKGNEDLIPWITRSLNPRIHFEYYDFKKDDKRVVLFKIPAAVNRPIKFMGKAYVRIGSSLTNLDDFPDKQRLIWLNDPSYCFEKEISKKSQAPFNVVNQLDYQSYYSLSGQIIPNRQASMLEKLTQERLLIKELNRTYSITNLGAILFARDLREFEDLERKAFRVIIYDGNDRTSTIKEQLGRKGYASGFEGLIDYINDKLPSKELIGDALRNEKKLYPKVAIRELVANAIIHQDFTLKGTGPMVEIFNNRVEISNPGKPLINTLRFIDHNPQSRNEKLASFMRRLNICEERGTGIDRTLKVCEESRLVAPKFIGGPEFTRVILFGIREFASMKREDQMRSTYFHCCLKYVSGEFMTNKTLRERFGVPAKNYSMISRLIGKALSEGLIKQYDTSNKSKKLTKYIPFWAN